MSRTATPDALIADILALRLPEAEIRAHLENLTPDRVDAAELGRWIRAIRQSAVPVPVLETPVMDCCGTGGSGLPHYNTSTTAAFVLAAGGVGTVKFGNRAIRS